MWTCKSPHHYINIVDGFYMIIVTIRQDSFSLHPRRHGGDVTPSGFTIITRTDWTIVTKLSISNFWTVLHLPWKFQVCTHHDLWPVTWFPRSCQPKFAFRTVSTPETCELRYLCCRYEHGEVLRGDIHGFHQHCDLQRSTEVIRGQWPLKMSFVIIRVFVPPEVIWCADFRFCIRLSFTCVEIGTLGSWYTPMKSTNFTKKYVFKFWPAKMARKGPKGIGT